jgi:hypothetical protein
VVAAVDRLRGLATGSPQWTRLGQHSA